MGRVRTGALVLAMTGLLLPPSPAAASRASLEGRGLPPLLAADPSLLRLLPASAAGLDPLLSAEYALDRSRLVWMGGDLVNVTESDRFALALFGRGLRYGYALDGLSHNLILASPAGWGVSLSLSDRFVKRETVVLNEEDPEPDSRYLQLDERSEREGRLGVGFAWGAARRFELGAGVSYFDRDLTSERILTGTDPSDFRVDWHTDPGLGIDGTVRTLVPAAGFLGAFRIAYRDLNWTSGNAPTPRDASRHLALQLGWRTPTPNLDDLVVGAAASWDAETVVSDVESFGSDTLFREKEERRFAARVFLSGEHAFGRLRARGGVSGSVRFNETVDRQARFNGTQLLATAQQKTAEAGVDSPSLFLGASLEWKGLVVDARIHEGLNLETPIVRWAATLKL